MIILVLRKNSGYRTVILSEIENLSSIGFIAQDAIGMQENKYNLSIITLDADKQPVITNVGKNISNNERKLMTKRILASNVDLWIGQDATRNILDKLDKKQVAIKLKRMGIGTLVYPLQQ